MESLEPALDDSSRPPVPDVDVLVVGAGITGIYQLYRACEAGLSARSIEAGGGSVTPRSSRYRRRRVDHRGRHLRGESHLYRGQLLLSGPTCRVSQSDTFSTPAGVPSSSRRWLQSSTTSTRDFMA